MLFSKRYKKGFAIIVLLIVVLSMLVSSVAATNSNPQPITNTNSIGDLPTQPQQDPLKFNEISKDKQVQLAMVYLRKNANQLGLSQADLADYVVTDHYANNNTGLTYIYLQQRYHGIEVYNAMINLTLDAEGEVLNVGNTFIASLQKKVVEKPNRLNVNAAVARVAEHLGLTLDAPLVIKENRGGQAQKVLFEKSNLSLEDIPAQLIYQPMANGEVQLAWQVAIYELNAENYWYTRIDAESGKVLDINNLVIHDAWGTAHNDHQETAQSTKVLENSPLINRVQLIPFAQYPNNTYVVYPMPMESPNHLLPPAADDPPLSEDNRVGVTDPASSASPYGWHDTNGVAGAEYTNTQGNNVHAYYDGSSSVADPEGGANLIFDEPVDLTQSPSTYPKAAIVNLFYWNNVIHDVWYNYGFDEASGNFQENNYGNGGLGGDSVNAEAQDASGTCNANMSTPTDGGNPRMQMYVCGQRDGDFDNGVIVHEYGHGISIRLTGGPSTSSCLNNNEQAGEGWSDWFGLMMTMEHNPDGTLADASTDARGIGTYLFEEASTGPGIRPAPYSTDMGINNYTYSNLSGLVVPHGVGFLWASMTWEMTWNLINQYGYDADLYNGTGGNNIAMQLVIEGLKLQPCSPGFVDSRDAILQADQNLNGGANQCLIWEAFAKRGLGASANQGSSSNNSDGTEAFDLPEICLQNLKITSSASPNPVNSGSTLDYTLTVVNDTLGTLTNVAVTDAVPANTTYVAGSANNSGSESGGTISFPGVTLTTGQSIVHTFQVLVDAGYGGTTFFNDDMESGSGNWTATAGSGSNNWSLGTASPYSGSFAWFAQDVSSVTDQYLAQSASIAVSGNAVLRVWHSYATESGYDGGVIEISTNGGSTWSDVGSLATQNGYNSTISTSFSNPIGGRSAFSGSSGGYVETLIDLSSYAGQSIQIRFRMATDSSVASTGWYVDDVEILDEAAVSNNACVTAAEGDNACDSTTTQVINTGGGGDPTPTPTPAPPTPTPTPAPPTPTPTNTPVPSNSHIGDLDDASATAPRNRWDAVVVVTVHDTNEAPLANATVSGSWSNGASGSDSCVTDATGQCSVTKTNLKGNVTSVTFSVTDVTHATNLYQASANHDADGDSDGTVITVLQP